MLQHKNKVFVSIIVLVLFFSNLSISSAGDNRAQYPPYLANAYFSVNIGYINYPFSGQEHIEPGFRANLVEIPHTGVRLMLYGRHINDYLSLQISYMRPVLWVLYFDVNDKNTKNYVIMNIGGVTAKPKLPLNDNLTLFGEFGLSVVTRKGFNINNEPVVKDANYATIMYGGGLKYHVNDQWDLMVHGVYSRGNSNARQPHSYFISPGFQYNMKPLSEEEVLKKTSKDHIFPKNQVMIEYTTNALGYGVNEFFSQRTIPVFWGGDVHVEKGFSVNYQRNVFHGPKVFSLDFGVSASFWETETYNTNFFTLAAYPLIRFTLLRTQPADLYFFYSAAGPAFISEAVIDDNDTGKRFTFHDYMGIGAFAGEDRQFSIEAKIGHYSNGNLFPQNAGVKVPLTFSVGYNF